MYYRIIYNYRAQELVRRFNSFDELFYFLDLLRKTGRVDAGTIYITTIL